MTLATKSIAPLDPQLTERLTATLGPPEPRIIQRNGDRDLALNAWVIGRGEVRATPDASQVERGTTVEITDRETDTLPRRGDVPEGHQEPGLFQQWLGRLDENGNAIRYQTLYHHAFPPRPSGRGGQGAPRPGRGGRGEAP